MDDKSLMINKIAQGLVSFEDGMKWFDALDSDNRSHVIWTLDVCIHQSHPSEREIQQGIDNSGLTESYEMLQYAYETKKKRLDMTKAEQKRAFVLTMHIFIVSDQRRRETDCKGECSHWWHHIDDKS